jgi:hypothetical protein
MGTVLRVDCPRAFYGCAVATVYYEYIVDEEKYGAAYEKPLFGTIREQSTQTSLLRE